MISLNSIIDFLMNLLTDDAELAAFEENPDAALAAAGLDGITGQDVRDAQLEMADRGLVGSGDDGGGSGGGGGGSGSGGGRSSGADDPVQAIQHTTATYHVTEVNQQNIVNIDDRDTIINDSFNSDDDVTIIDDSFNSSVENDVTAIQDNDTTVINAEDSFNSTVENDVVAIQDNDTTVNDNDVINDNDVVEIEDNDTEINESGTDGGGPPNDGISTGDIVAEEPDFETEVEPVADAEPEPIDAAAV